MNIQSVHDLQPRQEYYICLIPKGRAFKSIYLGCVKTPREPDFYFQLLERKGFKGSISFFGINEIGIGTSRNEARVNYGKGAIELPKDHFENETMLTNLIKPHENIHV